MHLAVEKVALGQTGPVNLPAMDEAVRLSQSSEHYTILVMKSNQIIEVAKYHREGDYLVIEDTTGRIGSLPAKDVDWLKTSEMTAEIRSVDVAVLSRQTH
jgi:hypothetical protein